MIKEGKIYKTKHEQGWSISYVNVGVNTISGIRVFKVLKVAACQQSSQGECYTMEVLFVYQGKPIIGHTHILTREIEEGKLIEVEDEDWTSI